MHSLDSGQLFFTLTLRLFIFAPNACPESAVLTRGVIPGFKQLELFMQI